MTVEKTPEEWEDAIEESAWKTLLATDPTLAESVDKLVKRGRNPKYIQDLMIGAMNAEPHVSDMVWMAARYLTRVKV